MSNTINWTNTIDHCKNKPFFNLAKWQLESWNHINSFFWTVCKTCIAKIFCIVFIDYLLIIVKLNTIQD